MIATRDQSLAAWSCALCLLAAAAWFGVPPPVRDARPRVVTQDDIGERQRLSQALQRVDELSRRALATKAVSVPFELIAPVQQVRSAEQVAVSASLDALSIVIVRKGAQRYLMLGDHLYRTGDALPDGNTLSAIRDRDIELKTPQGERRIYALGQHAILPPSDGARSVPDRAVSR